MWLDTFLQLTVFQRLHILHIRDLTDASLIKYTRAHILAAFDSLHRLARFDSQTIDNYPERTIPRAIQYKRILKVDPNLDSDTDITESEHSTQSDIPSSLTRRVRKRRIINKDEHELGDKSGTLSTEETVDNGQDDIELEADWIAGVSEYGKAQQLYEEKTGNED